MIVGMTADLPFQVNRGTVGLNSLWELLVVRMGPMAA